MRLKQLGLVFGNSFYAERERQKPTNSHRWNHLSLQSLGEDDNQTWIVSRGYFHAPMVCCIADAIDLLNFSTSDACSASTITRANVSVPE